LHDLVKVLALGTCVDVHFDHVNVELLYFLSCDLAFSQPRIGALEYPVLRALVGLVLVHRGGEQRWVFPDEFAFQGFIIGVEIYQLVANGVDKVWFDFVAVV